jgi:predicted RNA-binding Zn-ribbon protein involved in translation (DUF1610 family)
VPSSHPFATPEDTPIATIVSFYWLYTWEMTPSCSECGREIPPYSGKRRFTCSPECSDRRTRRHAGRLHKTQKACSECGAPCPLRPGRGAPFLTCSEDCLGARRRRLWRLRHTGRPDRSCTDCGCDISDRGPVAQRCGTCSRARRAERTSIKRSERAAQRLVDAELRKFDADRRTEHHLRSQYGIGRADFDRMSEEQSGLCLICGLSPVGRGKTDLLVVDHCHATGNVRGLLCGFCNIAIGLMKDDPQIVTRAARYLEEAARGCGPARR